MITKPEKQLENLTFRIKQLQNPVCLIGKSQVEATSSSFITYLRELSYSHERF